jgi:hypothetical protein
MKTLAITILLVAFLGLLAFTNPPMEKYEAYIQRRIAEESADQADLGQALGLLLGGFAGKLMGTATLRKDYVFLSIYSARLGEDELRVLGILNNFIVLEDIESRRK